MIQNSRVLYWVSWVSALLCISLLLIYPGMGVSEGPAVGEWDPAMER